MHYLFSLGKILQKMHFYITSHPQWFLNTELLVLVCITTTIVAGLRLKKAFCPSVGLSALRVTKSEKVGKLVLRKAFCKCVLCRSGVVMGISPFCLPVHDDIVTSCYFFFSLSVFFIDLLKTKRPETHLKSAKNYSFFITITSACTKRNKFEFLDAPGHLFLAIFMWSCHTFAMGASDGC